MSLPSQAWQTLSRCLPSRDTDSELWWQLTGRHLATLMTAADYSTDKQYEALLLHYHWTVPSLGQAPRSYGMPLRWRSAMQLDGSPLRYSWTWNRGPRGEPEISYEVEPISQFAGTGLDLLNQRATRDLLHQLTASAVPPADLRTANYFLDTLFEDSKTGDGMGRDWASSTTVTLALRFGWAADTPGLTVFLLPRESAGTTGGLPLERWESAVEKLTPDNINIAYTALNNFLNRSTEGRKLKPFSLSIDNLGKSHLKMYFNTASTSLRSVRDVMTFDGRIPCSTDRVVSLIRAVAGLPDTHPEDAPIPQVKRSDSMWLGYLYAFDVAPGRSFPEITLVLPVQDCTRQDDALISNSITTWMTKQGQGRYNQRYLGVLRDLSEHRQLDAGQGLQTHVSCRLRADGDVEVTSHLAPEAFHIARMLPRRSTRRRGDW